MMVPRIHSVSTRFHLYEDICNLDASSLQRQLTGENAETDHGLRFAKFFGRWRDSDSPELVKTLQTNEKNKQGNLVPPKPTQPLLDWLDPPKNGDFYRVPGHAFKTLLCGNCDQLNQACDRLAQLGSKAGATHFDLDLVSRLLIGIGLPHPTENGFLFHPTLAVPYIPGTALKQVARDWAEEEEGLEPGELNRLFGGEDEGIGCLAFLDALPKERVTLTAEQITSHYGGYYQNIDPANPAAQRDDMHQPADWHEPNPVTLLAVEAGFANPLPFGFAILPLRGAREGDVKHAQDWLTQGLEIYGVGARTTLGFGRFESEDARNKKEEDLKIEAQNAPPVTGDRVRILDTHRKAKQRGQIGTIDSIDEFGDVYVETSQGGKIKTRLEHVEKST